MSSIVISRNTVKRLAKDIAEIMKNPLTDNGIYYVHDETDMLRGQAVIVGPPDTPYWGGYYLLELLFPPNYPISPPKIVFYTNDGVTRFNPNLYKNGKVCLSIVNTWRGPQWTGCQTISSILLCICASVLTNTPLLNEPGITETHPDFYNYNNILTFKNYEIAIIAMLKRDDISAKFESLMPWMISHFKENYKDIMKRLNEQPMKETLLNTSIYSMSTNISYGPIKTRMKELYKSL